MESSDDEESPVKKSKDEFEDDEEERKELVENEQAQRDFDDHLYGIQFASEHPAENSEFRLFSFLKKPLLVLLLVKKKKDMFNNCS